MKKLISLVLALCMVFALATAFADVTITVNRDASYAGNGARDYTWYRVFSATYLGGSNSSSGGGVDAEGNPGSVTASNSKIAYIANSTVAGKLGEWKAATGTPGQEGYVAAHWEKKSGNEWFDLTPFADGSGYKVDWVGQNTTDRVQKASAWLIQEGVYEDKGTMTADGAKWTAEVPAGYYLIAGSEGANLIAATTDISIKEKNSYPTVKKEQKSDTITTYTHDGIKVAVNDVIDYQITVHIPGDANQPLAIIDTMTEGLTYDSETGLSVTIGGEATSAYTHMTSADVDPEYKADADWQIKFSADTVIANQNKDIVVSFKATVNEKALVDTGRQNEALIKYNNDHYYKTDKVDYTTYFTGIEKEDGDTHVKLQGVKFTLTESGEAFNVTAVKKGGEGDDKDDVLYYIPGGSSNEVVTDADGKIIIRGLDDDHTYVLTETYTLPGYNKMNETVKLNLVEDKGEAYTTNTYQTVKNFKGTVLPSTGGIGTTIFYILGGLLVVGAAVILIARRKAQD